MRPTPSDEERYSPGATCNGTSNPAGRSCASDLREVPSLTGKETYRGSSTSASGRHLSLRAGGWKSSIRAISARSH